MAEIPLVGFDPVPLALPLFVGTCLYNGRRPQLINTCSRAALKI